MTERSNAEVGALVRQRMKDRGYTERGLRDDSGVDRKTLTALLEGTRWPNETTRAKIEAALLWQVGAIEELRDGRHPIPIDAPISPVLKLSDDELLAELKRRLVSVAHQTQDLGGWGTNFEADDPGMGRDKQSG